MFEPSFMPRKAANICEQTVPTDPTTDLRTIILFPDSLRLVSEEKLNTIIYIDQDRTEYTEASYAWGPEFYAIATNVGFFFIAVDLAVN